MIRLVLGGDKSGKSDVGLAHLLAAPGERLFVATGKPGDLEFRAQILDHRAGRPARVPVVEADADLAGVLREAAARAAAVLVDSLDFWLFLAMQEAENGGTRAAEARLARRVDDFLESLTLYQGDDAPELTIVSSEIGLGPLAANAATRAFVRRLGALHRDVAARCSAAHLVVAGLVADLRPGPTG
ncbi:MAG: bifunctional adenosylcobinamide kinase/adenosylcobinamide-phosphate guanylyltransferase [Desulfovibrionaceae bacterium]|jgi:adenosylcobinamide kinase/adenosylcobinamide-phosphate guanylyltransferase|nr:bifunctional adenosylcobinamide kinase/adenosylcobinamide-phosphate guanylyltransferase [Desulfovibrionaceae bacterium]